MSDNLTKDDLIALRDHIDARLRDSRVDYTARFDRVMDHLERLNGAVARHEARIAEEAQKTRSLEKEVFARASRRSSGDSAPAVTRGDLKRIGAGLAVLVTVIQILWYVGGLAVSLAKTFVASGVAK